MFSDALFTFLVLLLSHYNSQLTLNVQKGLQALSAFILNVAFRIWVLNSEWKGRVGRWMSELETVHKVWVVG